MKTKLVNSTIASLLVGLASVTILAATASGQGARGGRLHGTWDMQITLHDCSGHVIRSFSSQVVFMAGGTLTEESSGTPPALRTGGKGVWSHTTDTNYAFRFKVFNFNAQNVFTGWSIIAGETTLDQTGDANSGPATVDVYDPNGVLLVHLCADAVGTRFEL
jgi:hypothetical protein